MNNEEKGLTISLVKYSLGFFGSLAVGLTILFVALKLLGYITWSWWQVFMPSILYICWWVPCCIIVVIILVLVGGIGLIAIIIKSLKEIYDIKK